MNKLDDLLTTPPADLIAELSTLRDQRMEIETKERLLQQILEMLSKQGGVVADEITELGASVGLGSLRKQVEQVLMSKREDGDDKLLVPQSVLDEIVLRGNRTVTLDNVRITMRRMAEDGELVRPDPETLLFGLPDTPGIEAALEAFKVMQTAQARAVQTENSNVKKGRSK